MEPSLETNMIEIHSLDDHRIAPYLTLRAHNQPEDKQFLVAEGDKVVQSLLQSPLEIVSFFAEERYYHQFADLLDAKQVQERYVADRSLLDQVVGYRIHKGVMALGKVPQETSLSIGGPIVALNRLANAENVGAILRNCAAFGFEQVVVDQHCSPPYLRRSVKTSMGAIFSIDLHTYPSLHEIIPTLKDQGYTIIAAALDPKAVPLRKFHFPKKTLIIFGSEGEGIDRDLLSLCDHFVIIPMSGSIDSLNAAAASSTFLYEMKSQINQ